MIKKLFYIICFLLIASLCYGADVFINDQCGVPGDGSNDSCDDGASAPFASITDISQSTNDDYWFACGHDENINTGYTITTGGTDPDYQVWGAFDPDTGVKESAVLGSGTFGDKCANGSNKPILRDSDDSGATITINTGATFVNFQNIHVINGTHGILNSADDCKFIYNYIEGILGWGIRIGLADGGDNNYVGYNYVSAHSTGDASFEGIQFGTMSDGTGGIAEYNVVVNFEHNGIYFYSGSANNIARYNKAVYTTFGGNTTVACFADNGQTNLIHHNYCIDGHRFIPIQVGSGSEVYFNVCTDCEDVFNAGGAIISIQPTTATDCNDNLVFNNSIIYENAATTNPNVLQYNCQAAGTAERNLMANNLIYDLTSTNHSFRVYDTSGTCDSTAGVDGNLWYNNLSYSYSGTNIAEIEGTPYADADEFNARNAAVLNNIETDPNLIDPGNGDYRLSSASTNGYAVTCSGEDCDKPFITGTDFTTNPITVVLGDSYTTNWEIGAFGFSPTTQLNGMSFNGIKWN